MRDRSELSLSALREIGWDMWDPIGLKDSDCPRDEYDTYLLHVSGWLKAGRQREEAVAYLVDIERRHMGLTGRTTAEECARQTVERIAALVGTKAVARARLLVVLDPAFGQRLQDLPPGRPAWIVMSPDNEPAIRTYWQAYPDLGHLNGVSGITPCSGASPEEELLANLDTIDLHHGPYSSASPYEELEVIGAHLSPAIETELATLGFTEFDDTAEGFLAHRTAEQASVRRD